MNLAEVFNKIRARDVFQNLPDAIFIVDEEGKIIEVNNKAVSLFETHFKPLTECHFDEIVADGMILAKNASDENKSVATGAFSANGSEIFVEISARKTSGLYFVTVRDITTLTGLLNLAEDTGKMNKEKNYMLYRLSGDIKSPLHSITGFSQGLLDGLGGKLNEKQKKYIKIINKNATELSFLLDKLLEFSYVESTIFTLEYKIFDVVNLIQNVIKSMKIEFEHTLDSVELSSKTIYTSEDALKTIMHNIIETSVRMPDAGALTVKLSSTTDNNIIISVSNDGTGLSEEQIAELFEPYGQLERKRDVLRSLSLTTARMLAKKLNGEISAASSMMQGTTFNVTLPTGKAGKE